MYTTIPSKRILMPNVIMWRCMAAQYREVIILLLIHVKCRCYQYYNVITKDLFVTAKRILFSRMSVPLVSVCNITIKADLLLARSNSTFGQIKSPALSGPNYCWYTLDPGYDRRVELQVYRIVNAGHFNGSRWVKLILYHDNWVIVFAYG